MIEMQNSSTIDKAINVQICLMKDSEMNFWMNIYESEIKFSVKVSLQYIISCFKL